ncbi:Helix-turn-helix, HxlR type domain protein [mine drainage metagenome]|uniref:Helix-turn-helix, HxlR type domain protein n=1 Tax=mine drainage metagenome TaxID=410659 RepID=T1C5N8_9ZZZZ
MKTARALPGSPPCDFEATFELLGQKHVLVILRALLEKSPRRFNELQESVSVNTATLSDRLKRLENLGIIQRRALAVAPRRIEYRLTPMGRDLLKIFRTMMEWRRKYSAGTASRERMSRTRARPSPG